MWCRSAAVFFPVLSKSTERTLFRAEPARQT
jgi:hypothetical protein